MKAFILSYNGDRLAWSRFLEKTEMVVDWRSDYPGFAIVISSVEAAVLGDAIRNAFPDGMFLLARLRPEYHGLLNTESWQWLALSQEYFESAGKRHPDPTSSFDIDTASSIPTDRTILRDAPRGSVLDLRAECHRIMAERLDWTNTTGSAAKWWNAFLEENKDRISLVLRLCEELADRKATIKEFFLAYVYSNTDNIQANLFYLDYVRLKRQEEDRHRAKKAQEGAPAPTRADAASTS